MFETRCARIPVLGLRGFPKGRCPEQVLSGHQNVEPELSFLSHLGFTLAVDRLVECTAVLRQFLVATLPAPLDDYPNKRGVECAPDIVYECNLPLIQHELHLPN